MNHRLVPYLLLAILTLGAGLGAGLALAAAPITYAANAPIVVKVCAAENGNGSVCVQGRFTPAAIQACGDKKLRDSENFYRKQTIKLSTLLQEENRLNREYVLCLEAAKKQT